MVYIINKQEYVLLHEICTDSNEKKIERKCKEYNAIIQNAEIMTSKTILGLLFGYTTVIKISILVPSERALEFSQQ